MRTAISVTVSPRRVATVLLNRADRGNAFNQLMLNELSAQLAALGSDETVRVAQCLSRHKASRE